MTKRKPLSEPILPTNRTRPLAQESGRRLARFADDDLTLRVVNSAEEITLPREAVRLLIDLLAQLGQGNPVAFVPYHAELTTHQAAEFLGVSRPHVIKLIESGQLSCRLVGTHRRIRFEDLLGYKNENRHRRNVTLDELAADAQANGDGY